MTRKKAGAEDSWTKEETRLFLHKKAQREADRHKKQEHGKKYKRVPILNGYKLVEIKE